MNQKAKILYVDLANKSTSVKELDAATYRKYPGGASLGTYLMLKEMDPTVDPFSPENMLIFSVSNVKGYPVAGLSRMTVSTKSPLTGGIGDAQVGGFIPVHLRANGYDSVVFKGKASNPVYLYIDGDNVEVRDATKMWGMTTDQTEDAIEADLGTDKLEMSVIGPAGENLVKYAAIIHMKNRANGRTGTGAVMGSKNLKALVVKRQPMPKPHDPEGLKTLTSNWKERVEKNGFDLGEHGTIITIGGNQSVGFLPSYNWNSGQLDGWEKIHGETLTETYLVGRDTCYACAIRCKREVEIPGKVDKKFGGPEYETGATFGSYCGNTSMEDLCVANAMCNAYGLDTISCGATIAWAMDCFEKGIITTKDTDGIELKFGNGKAFEPLIKKIALREEGIGNILADGSERAAKRFGPAAEDLVVTTKGSEWPAHMPQFKANLAVGYAVNNFGADHQSSEHDAGLMGPPDSQAWRWGSMLGKFEHFDKPGILDDNKAHYGWETQKYYSMMDTIGICMFAYGLNWQMYGPQDVLDMLKYTVNWDATIEELQEIGERKIVMQRMFNVKNGFSRKDDKLPKKAWLPITVGDETYQLKPEDFEAALDSYYKYAGWDSNGIPTKETLKKLDLDWI